MRWSDIPGFPGYRVTDDGQVLTRSKRGTTLLDPQWRAMKPGTDKKGYQGVTLCAPGHVRRVVRVHRLVAEAFVPNPYFLPCVRHLDGIPANNAVSNLAWGTYKQNEEDKRAHGTWDTRLIGRKLTDEQIRQVRIDAASGAKQEEIAKALGVSRPTITRILNGRIWRNV